MASLLPPGQLGLGLAGTCRMLGLLLRLEGVIYFMTGTRDLASTTPNYC